MNNNMGIYKITNNVNGHFYIGSAVNFNTREAVHKSELNSNIHKNSHLQYAWNKYGANNFEWSILEICENKNELVAIEQSYLGNKNENE